jgi:hypothetical protein
MLYGSVPQHEQNAVGPLVNQCYIRESKLLKKFACLQRNDICLLQGAVAGADFAII